MRDFLVKFGKDTIQIKGLNPAMALHALPIWLKARPVANSLARKPRSDIAELRRKVASYINMEEVMESRSARVLE